jgi:hypothetical protein
VSDRLAPCRLYLAADGVTVVFGDDERAAFLLCGVGAPIPNGFDPPASEKVEASPTTKPESVARAKKSR